MQEKPVVPWALRTLGTKTARTWFKFQGLKRGLLRKTNVVRRRMLIFKRETLKHGIISSFHFRSANRAKCHQNCFFTPRSQSDLGSTPKQKTRNISLQRLRIGHVRYINILTWQRGFQDKRFNLALFSLYPTLFWELRDEKNSKICNFEPKGSEPC